MGDKRSIKDSIRQLSGTFGKDLVSVFFATVDSVDQTANTCNCTPIGSDGTTSVENVLLSTESNDGILIVPSVDSTVLIGISDKNIPFVLMYEDIDVFLLTINNTKIKIQDGLTQFNDGSFGGFTKTQELKLQIDRLNAQLQAVISSLTNWAVAPSDGGAALKTYFATQIAGKPAGDFSNIENALVKHGS